MNRRGFSLVETLVTVAIIAVIAGAVMGVISVAVRASGIHETKESHADAVSRMNEEISRATEVLALESHLIRIKLAPRGGSASEDLVEYSWSGRDGDALVRRRNVEDARAVVDGVSRFSTVAFAQRLSESDGTSVDVDESRVIVRNVKPGAEEIALDRGTQIEYAFTPTLDANALSWRPTELKLMLSSDGERTGLFTVSVYRGNSAGRASRPLVTVTVSESSLAATASMYSITFNDVSVIEPGIPISIVFADASDRSVARVGVHHTGIADRAGILSVRGAHGLESREYPSGMLVSELSGIVTKYQQGERSALRGRAVEISLASADGEITTQIPLLALPQVVESRFVREEEPIMQDSQLATEGGG